MYKSYVFMSQQFLILCHFYIRNLINFMSQQF